MTNTADELSGTEVADWLRAHPEFFLEHPELLDGLRLPQGSGETISITDFHVANLRERHREHDERLRDLTGNARENEAIFGACRQFIIELLDMRGLDELLQSLENTLCSSFELQATRIISTRLTHSSILAPRGLEHLCTDQSVFLGHLRAEETTALFGPGSKVRSAAIAPLRHGSDTWGHLALGSSLDTHFDRTQGTLFVDFVADAVTRLLLHHQIDVGTNAAAGSAQARPAP